MTYDMIFNDLIDILEIVEIDYYEYIIVRKEELTKNMTKRNIDKLL